MKFKVIFHPDFEDESIFNETCATLTEAKAALNAIANYTLFLHDKKFMPDYSNCGWIAELVNGEWQEIEY